MISDAIALRDHALIFGVLAAREAKFFRVAATTSLRPRQIPSMGPNPRMLSLDILGDGFVERLEVALDDGGIDTVKHGLGVERSLRRAPAARTRTSSRFN